MRKRFIIAIIISLAIGISIGVSGNICKKQDEVNSLSDKFYINYTNENKKEKIRYKYILNYETEDAEILSKLDFDKPLISISHNGVSVHSSYPSFTKRPLIPEVSSMKVIKPNQDINENFEVFYNDEMSRETKEKIRFEAYVYIEKLYKGKWEPIYQAVFMKRGPYWSLNKSPI